MLIDALRADNVLPLINNGNPSMPFLARAIQNKTGLGFLAKAHPPTVTMPRIKVGLLLQLLSRERSKEVLFATEMKPISVKCQGLFSFDNTILCVIYYFSVGVTRKGGLTKIKNIAKEFYLVSTFATLAFRL